MMRYVSFLLMLTVLLGLCAGCGAKTPEITPDVSLFDVVCSADEALERAKAGNVVVMEKLRITSGREVWDDFYHKTRRGKSAQVLCAMYYTLDPARIDPALYAQEKDKYPKLFFYLVTFDGKTYNVKARLSREDRLDYQSSFPYLLYLTDGTPPQADYSCFEHYVLVDDPTATWAGIEAGLVSSQFGVGYRHCTVCENIVD